MVIIVGRVAEVPRQVLRCHLFAVRCFGVKVNAPDVRVIDVESVISLIIADYDKDVLTTVIDRSSPCVDDNRIAPLERSLNVF